jgi:hypothetical protein
MLQVSGVESEWLKQPAQLRSVATLVAHVNRSTAQAFNVTGKITGSNSALAPLVLMAQRGAWRQSASEQGSRLVCLLESLRVLVAGKPVRDTFFVALSVHELGFLGIQAQMNRRTDLVKRACAWIFLAQTLVHHDRPISSTHPTRPWKHGSFERW